MKKRILNGKVLQMKVLKTLILIFVILTYPIFAEAEYSRLDKRTIALYDELKQIVFTPLDPATLKASEDYKIKNADGYLKKTTSLLNKIHNLPESIRESYDDHCMLLVMQDILILHIESLELFLNGKLDMTGAEKWHRLHNKWFTELDNLYKQSLIKSK